MQREDYLEAPTGTETRETERLHLIKVEREKPTLEICPLTSIRVLVTCANAHKT